MGCFLCVLRGVGSGFCRISRYAGGKAPGLVRCVAYALCGGNGKISLPVSFGGDLYPGFPLRGMAGRVLYPAHCISLGEAEANGAVQYHRRGEPFGDNGGLLAAANHG